MTKDELKVRAFDVRHQIDLNEVEKQRLVTEYNQLMNELGKLEQAEIKPEVKPEEAPAE